MGHHTRAAVIALWPWDCPVCTSTKIDVMETEMWWRCQTCGHVSDVEWAEIPIESPSHLPSPPAETYDVSFSSIRDAHDDDILYRLYGGDARRAPHSRKGPRP